MIVENFIKAIYDVIEDVSDGYIGFPKLKIMVMYIDFGGNQMLKKRKSFGPGGSPSNLDNAQKKRR